MRRLCITSCLFSRSFCFLFDRPSVRISGRTSVILTEVLRCFPQSLQTYAVIASHMRPRPLARHPYDMTSYIYHVKKLEHRLGWCRGNALSLSSGGALFEFRPGDLLSWLRFFIVLLSPALQFRDSISYEPWPFSSKSFPLYLAIILSLYAIDL
jgi:hypothetical protein